jgi:hypothetical protein
MPNQFNRHYTPEEARALLPKVREWLGRLIELRSGVAEQDEQLVRLLSDGQDIGGPVVKEWLTTLAAIKDVLNEFQTREIQIKDLERGLVDFPAFHKGREVFLCWEQGEDDIEFWHELDTGYAGRERI